MSYFFEWIVRDLKAPTLNVTENDTAVRASWHNESFIHSLTEYQWGNAINMRRPMSYHSCNMSIYIYIYYYYTGWQNEMTMKTININLLNTGYFKHGVFVIIFVIYTRIALVLSSFIQSIALVLSSTQSIALDLPLYKV